MSEPIYDVLIAGAGFAGAAAASVLQNADLKTAVLEARDRAGGRAYTRRFAGTSDLLEFGGSWIAPHHHRVRHYAESCNFLLRPTSPILVRRWHDGTALRTDAPASPAELKSFESGIAQITSDAKRFARGLMADANGATLVDISMSSYLHRINASRALRSQAMAWWCISGNGDPNFISVAEFISSCAHGDGTPEGMMHSLRHSLVSGAGDLVSRMIEACGAELHLGAEVKSVKQFRSDVILSCANGLAYRARAAVVALPLNVLASLSFAPSLGRRKEQALKQGHGGRAFKLWIKARGPQVGTIATGGLTGVQWAFVEREAADGSVLIVGFGLLDGKFDPASPTDVETGLKRFFPESKLLSWDWHDWVSDPFSKGTWLALPAQAAWIGDHSEWRPEGKVFFASADFAPDTPGWFESAINSGEAAAQSIIGMFAKADRPYNQPA